MLVNIETNPQQRTISLLLENAKVKFQIPSHIENDDNVDGKMIASNMISQSKDEQEVDIKKEITDAVGDFDRHVIIYTDYTTDPDDKYVSGALYYVLNDQPEGDFSISVIKMKDGEVEDFESFDIFTKENKTPLH